MRLAEFSGHLESWVWEVSFPQLAELAYALAVADLRLSDLPSSITLLESAVSTGWRDVNWLENDPEIAPLRENRRFCEITEQIRFTPLPEFRP
jgi:hypothetical protein